MNESGLLYVLVSNATRDQRRRRRAVHWPTSGSPGNRRVRTADGKREMQVATSIDDLGDLRNAGAPARRSMRPGMTAVPDTGYETGALVDLPDWKKKTDATIGTGQQPRIALLRPVGWREVPGRS